METIYERKTIDFYRNHLIAAVILLLLLICTAYFHPFHSILLPPSTSDLTQISQSYTEKDNPYVNLYISSLYYTGYDNTSDGKVLGHYYYTIEEDTCMFFLIKAGDSSPTPAITEYRQNFKLIRNTQLMSKLTASLANEVGWTSEALKKITVPMLASETDYPHTSTVILAILLCIIILVLLVYIIICISRLLHPDKPLER